jgi:DNA-binding MarR family transcriptional regulator
MNQPIHLKEPPRLECFMEASKQFPDCDPKAMFAFTTLFHTYDVLWKQKRDHYTKYGITQGRFMIMILLMNNEEPVEENRCTSARTPAELADLAQVSRASVTGLLDSLEKDEFVRREPDANDRRMVSIHFTEKGKTFMDKFLPPHFKMMNKLMGGLKTEEQEQLVGLLDKLVAGVNAYVDEQQEKES